MSRLQVWCPFVRGWIVIASEQCSSKKFPKKIEGKEMPIQLKTKTKFLKARKESYTGDSKIGGVGREED